MKADTVDLAAIFGKPVHYLVPLYQRPYVWTREDQWERNWLILHSQARDVLRPCASEAGRIRASA